jgi:hypothetical protein
MKKVWWITIGIIVLLGIFLIWGYIGKIYTDTHPRTCDVGIKEKINQDSSGYNDSIGIFKLREYNTYLCWTWHKQLGLIQDQVNEKVKNDIHRVFGP